MRIIKLFVFSIFVLTAKITDASIIYNTPERNQETLSRISQSCKKYYNDNDICNCVLNVTKIELQGNSVFPQEYISDDQINTHVRGSVGLCEMDFARAGFNQ